MIDYRLLIGGELVEGDGVSDVINPATGTSFASVAKAGERHVDRAVAAAKAAFRRGRIRPSTSERPNSCNWPMRWENIVRYWGAS